MAEFLTIGELARRTGVTTSALRYYDELGLVRPTRRVSGHRRYGVDAVAAVGFVRFLQEVGFTLAETKLIASREGSPGAWRSLAVRKSEELRHRIARDEAARQAIDHALVCPEYHQRRVERVGANRDERAQRIMLYAELLVGGNQLLVLVLALVSRAYERLGYSLCGVDVTLYDATPYAHEAALFLAKSL